MHIFYFVQILCFLPWVLILKRNKCCTNLFQVLCQDAWSICIEFRQNRFRRIFKICFYTINILVHLKVIKLVKFYNSITKYWILLKKVYYISDPSHGTVSPQTYKQVEQSNNSALSARNGYLINWLINVNYKWMITSVLLILIFSLNHF